METVYDLNYDEISDENILKAIQYLDDNVSYFDIVAKQILGENYLKDADEARKVLWELQTTSKGGADSGISGFIYYSDTSKFYKDNFRKIEDFLEEMAQEQGYDNALELLSKSRGVCLSNIEDTCAKIVLEEVSRQAMDIETSDLDLSDSEKQDSDGWRNVNAEPVINELIASGCKFSYPSKKGDIKIETNDAKEILEIIKKTDSMLQVYKDDKYLGFLITLSDNPYKIYQYSDGLRDFSETLDAIRTVDEFIDDYKEKLNSNVKKQK